MKIFTVEFQPLWPVGCHLIIAARSKKTALKMARKKTGQDIRLKDVDEIDIKEPTIVSFDNGNY